MTEIFSGRNVKFEVLSEIDQLPDFKKKNRPDLLMISLTESDTETESKVKKIRALPDLEDVPIILITSFEDTELIKRFSKLNQLACLSKPLNLRLLTEQINYLLKLGTMTELIMSDNSPDKNQKEIEEELIAVLETQFIKLWENTKSAASFSSIELFATKIIQLGKKYNRESILKYGEDLSLFTRNFDIDNIHKLLNEFPQIVEGLKQNRIT
jgi:response regulator RpfG family c-di-GMP phosphodiesterase